MAMDDRLDIKELQARSTATRLAVMDVVEVSGSGHYGSGFSCVELMVALYYDRLSLRPEQPDWLDRDRFVLSKGHAAVALYPILADLGFFDRSHLETYSRLGSILGDHPNRQKVPGIDYSSGSLGHGLSVASGMSAGQRARGVDSRVVVMLGDGELHEGQNWEAAAWAGHREFSNLLAVVDNNRVCVDGDTQAVLGMEPLEAKFEAFGWRTARIDGHDFAAIRQVLDDYDEIRVDASAPPTVVVADTIAGRGVPFIEGESSWHLGYLHGPDADRARDGIRSMYAETTGGGA